MARQKTTKLEFMMDSDIKDLLKKDTIFVEGKQYLNNNGVFSFIDNKSAELYKTGLNIIKDANLRHTKISYENGINGRFDYLTVDIELNKMKTFYSDDVIDCEPIFLEGKIRLSKGLVGKDVKDSDLDEWSDKDLITYSTNGFKFQYTREIMNESSFDLTSKIRETNKIINDKTISFKHIQSENIPKILLSITGYSNTLGNTGRITKINLATAINNTEAIIARHYKNHVSKYLKKELV